MLERTHVPCYCYYLLLCTYMSNIYVTYIPTYTEVETKEPDAVSPLGPSFERRGKCESEDVKMEHSEYNEGNQMREM